MATWPAGLPVSGNAGSIRGKEIKMRLERLLGAACIGMVDESRLQLIRESLMVP